MGSSLTGIPGELASFASCERAVDDEDDQRTDDREDPGRDVEEVLQANAEDGAADETTEESADYTQYEGDDPAASLSAREDQLSDRASNESKEEKSKKAHDYVYFLSCLLRVD
ncbi:MAG: hypothetical protein JWQ43_2135 [Glaciihabitans sp.]|nr:hypothetical protein [Glaciihabitans sp.]